MMMLSTHDFRAQILKLYAKKRSKTTSKAVCSVISPAETQSHPGKFAKRHGTALGAPFAHSKLALNHPLEVAKCHGPKLVLLDQQNGLF
jgi:hypothetical protein